MDNLLNFFKGWLSEGSASDEKIQAFTKEWKSNHNHDSIFCPHCFISNTQSNPLSAKDEDGNGFEPLYCKVCETTYYVPIG